MTISQALNILNLGEKKPSLLEIKSMFRALAKKYHPDLTNDPSTAEHFILVNAAYELLIKTKYYSDNIVKGNESEIEDEALKYRLKVINEELSKIHKDFLISYNKRINKLILDLMSMVDNFYFKSSLRDNVGPGFKTFVDSFIDKTIVWYNNQLDIVSNNYNNWIYKFADETLLSLKKQEKRYFYLSILFYKCILPPLGLSFMLITFASSIIKFPDNEIIIYSVVALLGITIGVCIFLVSLKNKYSHEKIRIDARAFHLTPSMLNFDSIQGRRGEIPMFSAPQLKMGANLATSYSGGGLGLGLMVAAGGLLLNGAIGLLNSLGGDSMAELKQKAKSLCLDNIKRVDKMIEFELNKQLDIINNKFNSMITKSYNTTKNIVIKGLLQKSSNKLLSENYGE